MISMPVFAKCRSLDELQLSISPKAQESWILAPTGMSLVFKHSAIKGANSNMAVKHLKIVTGEIGTSTDFKKLLKN